jgi:hypothetical protein
MPLCGLENQYIILQSGPRKSRRIEHRSIKEEANNATPFQKDEGCKTPEKDQ